MREVGALEERISSRLLDLVGLGGSFPGASASAGEWPSACRSGRLHEAGWVEASPQKIIAEGTDWRFLNELNRELKA